MEYGILEAWVALLQESPTGSHLHGDTAWFVKHSRAFRDGKKKKKKKKNKHTHTQKIGPFCLAREVGLEF